MCTPPEARRLLVWTPGDEVGNGKKGDEGVEGNRCEDSISRDKGLAITLRALESH